MSSVHPRPAATALDGKPPRPAWSFAWRTLMRGLRVDARAQMAAVQLAAIGASLALLLLEGRMQGPGDIGFSIVIVVGIGLLRVLTAGVSLAMSTLLIEPIGSVLLLAGTGGPLSPFLPMAVGGIWWAALSPRGTRIRPFRIVKGSGTLKLEPGQEVELGTKRPTWLVYGVSMAAAYALLVMPPAMRDGLVTEAFEDAIVLGGVWLLAELSVFAGRRRATDIVPSAAAPAASGDPVGPMPLEATAVQSLEPATTMAYVASLELAPTTEHVGLTPGESHLLACLALGMSNRQIADLLQVSAGSVRYRLTLLYRTLGVDGRARAVERAREMQLAIPIDQRGTASLETDS
jgi:DNA-binding CsgD family transcriptional regulator